MAADTSSGAQLKAALSKYRDTKRHGKYPEELRQRAVEYSKERRLAGASVEQIAEELGVRQQTAKTWTSAGAGRAPRGARRAVSPATKLSLVPVVVRPQAAAARATRLDIELPDGTRVAVSGFSVLELAEAIAAMRRGR